MKKNTFPCWPALLSLTILCMPLPAHGQSIVAETLANISGALFTVVTPETSNCYGQYCAFIGLADALVFRVRPILILIAGLLIAIQGYRMVIGQEDEVTGKAKATVTACLAGIVLLFLYRPFIQAFYGNMGSVLNNSNVSVGANIISTEVAGLINWALVLVAVIAITMMIISAIQAIATSFNEDGTAKLRRTVLSVAAGIFIIILRGVITRVFGLTPAGEGISPVNPTPNALIAVDAAVSIVRFFLGFLGIIALGIVIYAGILMIFNLGDEGRVTKARELLYRAGIGLVVILVSLAIVSFVIQIA